MRQTRTQGRYGRIDDATPPGPDLPRIRLKGRVETVTAAVPDPNIIGAEKLKRQRVSINRLTDPLECERSFGRITESAYLAGRLYMSVCERAASRVAGISEQRTHGAGNRELAMARRLDAAEKVVLMQESVSSAIGALSALILRAILQDGHSLDEAAAIAGIRKRRKKQIVAREFREGLEAVAKSWDRYGWPD